MKRILNEDAQISSYIKNVVEKVEEIEDQIVEMAFAIDDIKDNWDQNMQAINERLYQNAVANGITTEKFKFMAFKIKDFDEDYLYEK